MTRLHLKNKALLYALLILSVFLFLGGCSANQDQQNQPEVIFAYVGANLKEPVTELAKAYEQKTGVVIELTFNNSGALLNQLDTMKKGDIYMPGGMSFVEKAKEKGHIGQVMGPIAYHTPVMITPKGNPGKVYKIEDLANEGVKLIVPDKEATALGKAVFKTFDQIGLTQDIEKNVMASLESPAKVLVAIMMGQGNVGIVEYSNTFKEREAIEIIDIDPLVNHVEEIPICSLIYTNNPEGVEDFMQYVLENGPAVFGKYGFKTN